MRATQHSRKFADPLDLRFMARALVLARKGEGSVEPNPMVGCVIARGRRVISEGYHRRFGGPHAEVVALRSCTESPRGSTVYVSLEPCCHHGKTPPCVDALIDAGVARVVVAMGDPSDAANGRGIRKLRSAGIAVQTGLLADEAAQVLAPFLTRVRLKRPYVIAKWAQSLDGKLATAAGESKWISCDASRRRVHRLRGRVDAILVGSGTVLADDPLLTAREVRLRRLAMRVVLDARLRIPIKCQLVVTSGVVPTLVFTAASRIKSRKADTLKRNGVVVVACRSGRGGLSFTDCMRKLAARDVTNVLIEGGGQVLTSVFKAGLVDEAHVFTAPMLIGGDDAPGVLGGLGRQRINTAIEPKSVTIRRSGRDIMHLLRFTAFSSVS